MGKLLKFSVVVIWFLDIFNVPGMEALDTVMPMNALFWTALALVWILFGD